MPLLIWWVGTGLSSCINDFLSSKMQLEWSFKDIRFLYFGQMFPMAAFHQWWFVLHYPKFLTLLVDHQQQSARWDEHQKFNREWFFLPCKLNYKDLFSPKPRVMWFQWFFVYKGTMFIIFSRLHVGSGCHFKKMQEFFFHLFKSGHWN